MRVEADKDLLLSSTQKAEPTYKLCIRFSYLSPISKATVRSILSGWLLVQQAQLFGFGSVGNKPPNWGSAALA